LNGTTLGSGSTVWLPNGTYPLAATIAPNATFVNWTTSWSALRVLAPASTSTSVTVQGPGTVYALTKVSIVRPIVLATVTPGSATVRAGGQASFSVAVECLGNTTCPIGTTYVWTVANPSVGSLNTSTGPSVRFSAAQVYASTQLVVNATLNGTTVESGAVVLAVVPALTAARITPAAPAVYSGQAANLGATLSCTANLSCPSGGTFVWALIGPSLGSLTPTGGSGSYPSTAQFLAAPGASGVQSVSLRVVLNGVNATGFATVTVTLPSLTSVVVNPASLTTGAGVTTNFTALGACTLGLACPAAPTFAWTLSSSALGALGASSGTTVAFTSGTSNLTGWLNVTGTLNGVSVAALSVMVSVHPATPVLEAVTVSPSPASLSVGSALTFTASLACAPAPCPSGVTVVWAVSPAVGTLSTTSGSSTTLTATAVGIATVYANATFGGKTVSGSASPVTVTSAPGGTTTSTTPLYENPLLWVAVVVVLVVIVAAIVLLRRGAGGASSRAPGEKGSPGGSPGPGRP